MAEERDKRIAMLARGQTLAGRLAARAATDTTNDVQQSQRNMQEQLDRIMQPFGNGQASTHANAQASTQSIYHATGPASAAAR
jgi:hypothetical protein